MILAFHFGNNFDKHYRMFTDIPFRNKIIIVVPEMTSEANLSHSPLFLGHYSSYCGDQDKKEFHMSEKEKLVL